jgi:hypothetical protein
MSAEDGVSKRKSSAAVYGTISSAGIGAAGMFPLNGLSFADFMSNM